jgi:hypothetical protein
MTVDTRPDGLITPENIIYVNIKSTDLTTASADLYKTGQDIILRGGDVVHEWSGLEAYYESPDAATLLSSMSPVSVTTSSVGRTLMSMSGYIDTFAEAVSGPVKRLKDLQTEAETFVKSTEDGFLVDYWDEDHPLQDDMPYVGWMFASHDDWLPAVIPWDKHHPSMARNTELLEAVNKEIVLIDEARVECVNSIRALNENVCIVEEVPITEDQLNEMDADVSWGHTGYGDQSCVEAFSQSAIDTFIEGIDGAGALMAIDPYGEDPSEVFFQGDLFRDAWSNLGQTLGAIGFSVPTLITQKIGKENVWPWLADASTWTEEKLTALAYGFVGTEDEWEDNPARASGALAMGLASILLTKGGGGAKAASTASRVASVVEKASALLKRTEHLGDDGIKSGAVKSSTVISELAESLEKSLVGGAKDADLNLSKTIDDLNTKLDDSTSVLTDRRPDIDPPEGKHERTLRESGEFSTVPAPDPVPVTDVARAIDDQPMIGSHEGGPGEWELQKRNANGMADQEFATGVRQDGTGHIPEYVVPHKGHDVEFDSFRKAGDPPVEVFQEVKGDYDILHSTFKNVNVQIDKWVEQATRQAEAIRGRGAEHQWIFTRNPELAQQVAQRFEDAGLDVDVLYVPKVT